MKKFIDPNQHINEKINSLMKTELIYYTCQFFTKSDNGIEPFASGVFVFLCEKFYILTASHVSVSITNTKNLYIRYKDNFINVTGIIRETDLTENSNIDIAYIKIEGEMVDFIKAHYKFLTISKIRKHSLIKNAANYCVLGFPVINKTYDGERIRTGASSFLLQPANKNVYDYYKIDELANYVLEFKGKGIDLKTGFKTKVNNEFYGLSGCGLWLLLINSDGFNTTIDYRLIGIMTEFKNDRYYCLIGNRIELILQALIEFEGLKLIRK